uniref:Unclassified n=1 Tax=Fusarium clavum TaxID=2594811 RepID=W1IC08_9HYPO|nr:unclassified [Fusarium clavum]CEF82661.1 unclassified [Fusarium clavum]
MLVLFGSKCVCRCLEDGGWGFWNPDEMPLDWRVWRYSQLLWCDVM